MHDPSFTFLPEGRVTSSHNPSRGNKFEEDETGPETGRSDYAWNFAATRRNRDINRRALVEDSFEDPNFSLSEATGLTANSRVFYLYNLSPSCSRGLPESP
jgi:hypothetical protein